MVQQSEGPGTRSCDVSIVDPSIGQMKSISSTLRHNYFIIAITVGLTIVAIVGILFMISYMIDTVRTYYRYMRHPPKETRQDNDDYVYGSRDYEEPNDEYGSIRSRIARIKNIYGPYNKAMGSYSRNVLNREPDDIMDENIISREGDDYKYGSAEGQGDD